MCGIAGVIALSGRVTPAHEAAIATMLRVMRHRGPDRSVRTTHGGLACAGSVRLAIVDPSGSDQPLSGDVAKISLYFNGEIYNHRQLRRGLRGLHRWRTAGDGESIVHLYEERPEDFATALDGMFAFALIDETRRTAVLGRDRFGIKPLYYWIGDGLVCFASELTALLRCPWIPLERDDQAIHEYLAFGFALPPATFARGVRQVEPGCLLVVGDGRVGQRRYWSPEQELGGAGPVERFGEVLEAAVATTYPDDRPAGVFLSGGLDSSAVAAMAAPARPVCFTVGYDAAGAEDERRWAAMVAAHLGLAQREELVRREEVPRLLDLVSWSMGEPLYSTVCMSTFVMSELAARRTRVVLSGDGADELLLGYPHFREAQRSAQAGEDWRLGYREKLAVLDQRWRLAVSGPRLRAFEAALPEAFAAKLAAGLPAVEQLRDFELRYRLPGYHLNRMDRLSMAHALEVRVPFLRNDVVAAALRRPAEELCRDPIVKRPLVAATRAPLPPAIVERPKQKFSVPLATWVGGELLGTVNKRLSDERRLEALGLQPSGVARLLDAFGRQPERHLRAVWGLLVLATWNEAVWERLVGVRRTTAKEVC